MGYFWNCVFGFYVPCVLFLLNFRWKNRVLTAVKVRFYAHVTSWILHPIPFTSLLPKFEITIVDHPVHTHNINTHVSYVHILLSLYNAPFCRARVLLCARALASPRYPPPTINNPLAATVFTTENYIPFRTASPGPVPCDEGRCEGVYAFCSKQHNHHSPKHTSLHHSLHCQLPLPLKNRPRLRSKPTASSAEAFMHTHTQPWRAFIYIPIFIYL